MPFTARKLRIYRKTLVADTFAGLAATEKIEFNANGQDNTIVNAWTKHIHHGAPRALAQHPNPNEELSEQQDTGKDEEVYEIDFVISKADDVSNSFIVNLLDFNANDQELPVLPFGRFSIEIDRAPGFNRVSNATDGLEIADLFFDMDEDTPNELTGTIILSRGKAAT